MLANSIRIHFRETGCEAGYGQRSLGIINTWGVMVGSGCT
jgi:hypothetical protein